MDFKFVFWLREVFSVVGSAQELDNKALKYFLDADIGFERGLGGRWHEEL